MLTPSEVNYNSVSTYTAFTYYVRLIICQMHVCLITSFIKIITKCIAVVYLSQDGFMLRLIIMHVFGLWYTNTAVAIKRVRW